MRIPSAGLTIGFSLALLGATTAVGRSQDDLKSALPPHTLLYAAAPDFDSWSKSFQTSALYKIWIEEEVQEFFGDLRTAAKQKLDEARQMGKQMHEAGALPIDPAELLKVRPKSAAFALTDLTLPAGPDKPGVFSAVLSLDFGDTGPVVEKALETLVQMGMAQAAQMGEAAPKLQTKEVAGGVVKFIQPPPGEEVSKMMPTLGLAWTFAGGRLLLGTDVQRLGEIAGALKGQKPAASLGTDATYRQVSSQVRAAASEVEIFVRPNGFVDAVMGGLRLASAMNPGDMAEVDVAGIERAVQALGFAALKGMGYASGYRDGKGVSQSYVLCPADQRRGLTALASGKPINRERLAWIPKAVSSFSMAEFGDLEGVYSTILDAVEAYNPDFRKMAEAQIQQVEQGLGFHFKKELFGAFGPEFMMYSMPVAGLMATPEMVFMLGCKNAERTVEVLKKLASLSEGHVAINDNKADGVDLYSIQIVLDDMGGGVDPMGMIDPTFTFKNGFLVFGLSRSDVKGALKRMEGQGGDDVRGNAAFKPYLDQLPAEIGSLSFTDNASTFDGIYSTLSGVMGMVPIPPDVPIDLGLLPSGATITKHLFGSVAWSTQDKDGFSGQSVGPLGPEVVVLAGVGLAAVMAAGMLGAVRAGR